MIILKKLYLSVFLSVFAIANADIDFDFCQQKYQEAKTHGVQKIVNQLIENQQVEEACSVLRDIIAYDDPSDADIEYAKQKITYFLNHHDNQGDSDLFLEFDVADLAKVVVDAIAKNQSNLSGACDYAEAVILQALDKKELLINPVEALLLYAGECDRGEEALSFCNYLIEQEPSLSIDETSEVGKNILKEPFMWFFKKLNHKWELLSVMVGYLTDHAIIEYGDRYIPQALPDAEKEITAFVEKYYPAIQINLQKMLIEAADRLNNIRSELSECIAADEFDSYELRRSEHTRECVLSLLKTMSKSKECFIKEVMSVVAASPLEMVVSVARALYRSGQLESANMYLTYHYDLLNNNGYPLLAEGFKEYVSNAAPQTQEEELVFIKKYPLLERLLYPTA